MQCIRKSKASTGKCSYTDFEREQVGDGGYTGEDTGKTQYWFWNAVTFRAEKFQVDVKKGEGGWPKRPVDVEQGKSEYVDGPLLIPVDTQD